ncbi:myelin and lymphocyte protein-like [Rhinoderma darwinii]|uniref:myelin and lymphocyte protein-like n=1 Tax=Rhinoderma darwinii TaxID=43563 RepID=UPI003F673F49
MLFIPELIFGGLVWSLIAATLVDVTAVIHGWVLFVNLSCFLGTLTLMCLYAAGVHNNKTKWMKVDIYYHFTAAALYISAAIINAIGTQIIEWDSFINDVLNMSVTVSAFFVMLIYCIHAAFSLKRKVGQAS